ncbi:MarR family transcriptional regulator [Halomonas shantousis]
MQDSDPREIFGQMLGQVARLWRAEIDQRLAPYGLTESRWRILLQLSRAQEAVTQTTLARAINVQGPTLVRSLDWLASQGLIERRATSGDRRVKTVHLTPKATPVLERIQSVASKVRGEILAGIAADDLQTCLNVFERIVGRLGSTVVDDDRGLTFSKDT